MRRVALTVAIVAATVVVVGTLSMRPGEPDARVPSTLARWVEPARQLARDKLGLAAILAPVRLSGARCSDDRGTAALMFEAGSGATAYVLVQEPTGPQASSPYATTSMVALTPAEFMVPPDSFSSRFVYTCGRA